MSPLQHWFTRSRTGVLAALLLLFAGVSLAQSSAQGWRFSADAGATHQWRAGLDGGGDLSIDAWALRASAAYAIGPALRLGIAAGAGERRYDFSGQGRFAGVDPWSKVTNARISGSVFWRPNQRWTLFAIPTIRWNAESDASMNDGRIAGLLGAASFQVNDRFSIGPGFGVFSELEEGSDWFPILAIDWRLTEQLRLSTGRGFAATRGPGLTLDWKPSDPWLVSLGGRYEKERFRLDSRGVAPNGIGQETSIPVFLAVTRDIGQIKLSGLAGVEFNGEVRLEDSDGQRLDRSNYDAAPFAGATIELSF